MFWKKTSDLEEKVKQLEGDVEVLLSTSQSTNAFTFNVRTSQPLHVHTLKNEWVGDSSSTHHMVKDASLFSSLDMDIEKKIYVHDDFFPRHYRTW